MSLYPSRVNARCRSASQAGSLDEANAVGTSASFVCGAFSKLSLRIDEAGAITDARFTTNGCGFMTAAADVVCGWLSGKSVTDLDGLNDERFVFDSLGAFPLDRRQCASIVFDALRRAMADYRATRVAEFHGDVALICTCFGVSEDTIVDVIATHDLHEVEDVSSICRAGSGCGSCRMLIRELIDARQTEER